MFHTNTIPAAIRNNFNDFAIDLNRPNKKWNALDILHKPIVNKNKAKNINKNITEIKLIPCVIIDLTNILTKYNSINKTRNFMIIKFLQ